MTKENRIKIKITLPTDVMDRFKKLAKAENKTNDQLFADIIQCYIDEKDEREWRQLRKYGEQTAKRMGITSDEDIVRIIHELRAEEKSGKDCGGLSDKKIAEIIRKTKGN